MESKWSKQIAKFKGCTKQSVELMNDYTAIVKGDDSISVCFYIEDDKLLRIRGVD